MAKIPFYIGKPKSGYKTLYGIQWLEEIPVLQIHLACFREQMAGRIPWGHDGKTPKWFFKTIARTLWPEDKSDEGLPQFIWNRWNNLMLDKACSNNYLAIAGCAGLGKSEFFAIWLIIQFLSDPENTLCMTTSTTLGASKMKMWSKVVQYWSPLEAMGMPGKLIDSIGRIRYVTTDGKSPKGDLAGITLIPSDRKKEKDALESIIGIHPKRAIFVADDLTGLSEAVTEAAFGNLSMGCEYFQFVGLANPKSYFDSFGKFAKPKKGWESITVEDEEWETDRGHCIHFDATKNPRISEGDNRLTWMLDEKAIEERKRIDGPKSVTFWRMVRGFWCPEGATEYVYTEIEIITNKGDQPALWLNDQKVTVAFLDPAFTHGGDRCICYFGTYGKNNEGFDCLEYNDYVQFHEDITNKEVDRTRQLINWWKQVCVDRHVSPMHAGMDSTAAGTLLDDVHLFWSKDVLGIEFGGKASDRAVAAHDPTPGYERYGNRCTEIWYAPKEALRTGQIRGMGPDLILEATMRRKKEDKTIHSRVFVLPKKEMKMECGFSPDCFIAGTMIHTISGEKPIECIKIGELILTPFGYSPVIIKHEVNSATLGIALSNGKNLIGKANHKIFTSKIKWEQLKDISVDTRVESVYNIYKWIFLNLLFTRIKNTGFKHLVDITNQTTRTRRRDYFIESYGQNTLALFLKACASIIKMVIGKIMTYLIYKSWMYQSMPECTCLSVEKICQQTTYWHKQKRQSKLLQHGIDQKRVGRGIAIMLKYSIGQKLNLFARSVLKNLSEIKHILQGFAQNYAKKEQELGGNTLNYAVFAIKNLLRGILKPNYVEVVAKIDGGQKTKVYNITLLNENAYYANGILVDNCADSAFGLAELCRIRFGFNTGRAAKLLNPQGSKVKTFKKIFQRMNLYNIQSLR